MIKNDLRSAIAHILSRWRSIAEHNVIETNKRNITASAQMEARAYALGIRDLAKSIEDEMERDGKKEESDQLPDKRCLCEKIMRTDCEDYGKYRVCERKAGHSGRHMTYYDGKRRYWPNAGDDRQP